MKKLMAIGIILIFLTSFCFGTTYTTIILDGILSEWEADEEMGTASFDGKNFKFWHTWDDTYLYLGFDRETTDWFLGDDPDDLSFFVAIDIDQISGSGGTSDGYGRVNFTNSNYLPEYIYYYAGGVGWYERSHWNGSSWDWLGWSNANTYYGWSSDYPDDEMAIPFSDIGNPSSTAIYAWFTKEGDSEVQGTYPIENPTGNNPSFDWLYSFGSLGANETPNDPIHTLPVELSSFTAQFMDNVPLLQWTTQTETDNMGFNIYRGENENAYAYGNTDKINKKLIPGQGTSSQPHNYEYKDESGVIVGKTYWYWLESVNFDRTTNLYEPSSLTIPEQGHNDITPETPDYYGLYQNYPNPFSAKGGSTSGGNPETVIRFKLKDNGQQMVPVSIKIFNINGELVETLVTNELFATEEPHEILWNVKDIGSGIYFCRLETPDFSQIRKMVILR